MEDRWIDVDGYWVHIVDWHPSTPLPDAPPIVLVHGLGGSTINWELVGAGLSERFGTSVTAVDLPGFGHTRSDHRPAGFDTHRHLVRALVRERGPSILAGNSMGGAISVSLAARHPELVSGLVLVNAAYPRPSRNLDQFGRTVKFATLTFPRAATPIVNARARRLGPGRLVDATLFAVLAKPDSLDPDLRDRLVALAGARRHYPEAAAAYAHSGGTLFRYLMTRMRADLDALAIPTLVVHGRQDQLVPVSFARDVARRHPQWTYVEFAQCGHAPQLEAPTEFLETVTAWANDRLPGPTGPA